ncbi:class I SAM-dependent methyltransferase [Methylobacterium gnaphalii]|uniref:Ubiquinone/menaquinone biosynthesis methyltransferase n=1 Tax=Methylobacterium gnaphalii TaxID=1010610 RepID=A0A512JRV8_9HYPH|nr:methyltransferase domain-containing protein [Methylobacterium gnaphalii]GEP12642.1 ubiquinone/menaquinone biosynthesis methyltransferase [Methylobacterium gnaphalii]GJD71660.1 2-methoxy-6-polyprenyl-1,4-benzoquinol methylase, mitochondrial [Methylobacterium gnaphalii]GLS49796.1 ubiquinone/menaquinone biosynthesis methyltransferase [Methylobacterium gnaphalii]
MAATDKAFTGSIPELYERHLVPLIFEPYAQDLAEEVRRLKPSSVLETAAGTGVVTRALTAVLPPATRLVATDLNTAMLDVARAHVPRECPVEWRQADALALPFEDETFDVVTCQFGAMFFPDKRQGFREAWRVLRPSGRFLFSVWDDIGANEFPEAVMQALADVFPDDPPRFLARTPYGYCDTARIIEDLTAAGFADVRSETVEHVSRSETPREPALAFCQGTPLRGEIEARDAACLEEATQRAAEALAKRFGEGPIQGRIRAIVFCAIR